MLKMRSHLLTAITDAATNTGAIYTVVNCSNMIELNQTRQAQESHKAHCAAYCLPFLHAADAQPLMLMLLLQMMTFFCNKLA